MMFLAVGWFWGGCASSPATFAPSHPLAPAQVTHRGFDEALRGAVQEGLVNYPALQADPAFAAYLAQLDQIDPLSLPSEGERLAFWINAYNAFAIKGILDGESPRPYVGWYRYFKIRGYRVGGVTLNLYNLEHEILRKQFREPRVHFAIVCASTSCPKLQSWAYRSDRLNEQLDEAARMFVNDPSRNRFDRQHKIAYLSKIFDWFEEDFVAGAGSIQKFVSQYVNDADLARDLATMPYRIEFLEYDWSLNGVPPKEMARAGSS